MRQRLKVVYRAKTILGRFGLDRGVSSLENAKITPVNDGLCLSTNSFQIRLRPLNEGAEEIESLFDMDPVNNASLYELSLQEGELEVIFHRFPRPVQKLVTPEQGQLNFYFENALVAKEESDSGLDEKGLIASVISDCVHSDSIFIVFKKDDRQSLSIIGDEYRYEAREERPGLFRIEKRYPVPMNLPAESFIQVYKGFRFLTWEESWSVASHLVTQFKSSCIPEMLVAWDNYIHFLEDDIKKKQKESGRIRFRGSDTEQGFVDVYFDDDDVDLDSEPLLHDGIELEMVSLDIDALDGRPSHKFFLGKPEFIKPERHLVRFQIKAFEKAVEKVGEMGLLGGYIRLSSFSVENESRRREKAYQALMNQTNPAAKNINRLMDPKIEDTAMLTCEKVVTKQVLDTMFGSNSEVILSETYRTAMDIAINTPDIALIQGPPGTGKTTLIKGVMARINAIDPLAKVLLTTEQHDALDNAVKGMKSNLPPIVASRRFDSSEEEEFARIEKTLTEFKLNLIAECDRILSSKEHLGHPGLEKIVYCLQKVRKSGFDKKIISDILPELKKAVEDESIIVEVSSDLLHLSSYATQSPKTSIYQDPLLKLINSQRTSKEAWSDDGPRKLEELLEVLEFNDHDDLIFDNALLAKLENDPTVETFVEYKNAVDEMRRKLFPQIGQSEKQNDEQARMALDHIQSAAIAASKETPLTIDGIIHEFREKANNSENIQEIVKNYASIVASTCAQATKVAKYSSIAGERAKYVIVDEAARVNPLELINAIMMGIKVILVGDQMQLPQYLEAQMVAKYEKDGGISVADHAKLLSQSLFGSLYENLDRAFKEGRIKARRAIRLDEQHRMNPVIGDFVSTEFYEGTIKNGDNTKEKINNFGLFNGKSLVFIDLPATSGKEEDFQKSKKREVEIEKTLEIMGNLFLKNPKESLEIGVLSFYKAQKEEIEARAEERFSQEQLANVEFGTVDSFQGKEFDIVLISCVRSNGADNTRTAVGFLSSSPNRINVALSRAKRLLVLVGDSETLGKSENLRDYVNYAKENGYYGAE